MSASVSVTLFPSQTITVSPTLRDAVTEDFAAAGSPELAPSATLASTIAASTGRGFNSLAVAVITVLTLVALAFVVGIVVLILRYRRTLSPPSARRSAFSTKSRTSTAKAPLYLKASLDSSSEKFNAPVFLPYIDPEDHDPFACKALPSVETRITACHWPAAPAKGSRIFGVTIPIVAKNASAGAAASRENVYDGRPDVSSPALAAPRSRLERHPVKSTRNIIRTLRDPGVEDLA